MRVIVLYKRPSAGDIEVACFRGGFGGSKVASRDLLKVNSLWSSKVVEAHR